MAINVKHSKVSTIPDGDDASLIRPSDWNDDHVLDGTVPVANGGTGAATLTGYVKGNGTSTMTASATIPNTDITGLGTMSTQNANNINVTGGSMSGVTVSGYIPTTEKAQPLGVATLDAGGKVPTSQIPQMGDLNYQGTWDASTNTPTLTSSVGTKGYYYVVNVAGSTNLNGITDWLVGDWAVYNGTVWQKIDNTDSVTSVNGLTGAVVLTTTNVAEGTNLYYSDARARASVSAGTGISYNSTTGVITNSSPSLGGDVVGPASATDNAVARFDTTTGKLLQNSVVTVGDTGAVSGVTTLAASTSVTTPIVQATNSGGLALKNSAGTTQMSVGAGGGDNMSINVSTNMNGTNAQIDISPTGTGHVHIKPSGTNSVEIAPTSAGTINNMVIGGTTPLAITGTTVTATTFSGSGASLTSIPNSALVNSAITINGTSTSLGGSISVGTVTSVTGTSPVVSSGGTTPAISMPAATSSVSGYLTSTDWNTFNNKGSGTVTSVSATAPITSSGGATPNLAMPAATGSVNGYLTSTDWTTFNSKGSGTVTSVAALTLGTTGTDLSSTVANGTTTPVITLQVPTASATNRGALSSTDWSTFNNKAPSVTYTTNYVPFGQGTTTPNLSASFTYVTGTGTLTAPVVSASNGLVLNSATVSTSFSIPSGSNAMSVGPITVASGQTVTVASGNRWVVL